MKRGRKIGFKEPLPRKGGIPEWLYSFEVGEKRYVDTTADGWSATMRGILPHKSRWVEAMQDYKFTANVLTCVSVGHVGDVTYLIRVERTA